MNHEQHKRRNVVRDIMAVGIARAEGIDLPDEHRRYQRRAQAYLDSNFTLEEIEEAQPLVATAG